MQIKTKSGYFYRNKANFPLACRKQIIKVVFYQYWTLGMLSIGMPLSLSPCNQIHYW